MPLWPIVGVVVVVDVFLTVDVGNAAAAVALVVVIVVAVIIDNMAACCVVFVPEAVPSDAEFMR